MNLLDDDALERSGVVANCRMNRERDLAGSNGYSRELDFHPLDALGERLSRSDRAAWLDLCCGTGKALIQAAVQLQAVGLADRVDIVGVDLVAMFHPWPPDRTSPRLVEASLRSWRPDRDYDLITCVHGLHYIGDKLGLIARAVSWLAEGGILAANLDLANFRCADGRPAARRVATDLRRQGLTYDHRRRLVSCAGPRRLDLRYRYLGADDRAGPNSTGQPAVDSYYELAT